jgi:3-oxoacyl-[acyl-carrier protein] reductase
MLGFTRSLAREVGRLSISMNAGRAGIPRHRLTHGLAGAQRQQVIWRGAMRRTAEAKDVANAVEYLLSDEARNISGTVLTVDAGSTA